MAESAPDPPAAMTDHQLAELGIQRIPADIFQVGCYRYSNVTDAIAAAERLTRTAKGE